MRRRVTACIAVVAAGLPAALLAESDLCAALERCVAIVDDAARLVCYDSILLPPAAENAGAEPVGSRAASAEAPEAEVATAKSTRSGAPEVPGGAPADVSAPAGETEVQPLDDSVGKQQIEAAKQEDQPTYTARLIRCVESGPSKLTLFYFENGQVWKQRGSGRRLRLRDCDYEAEIKKDAIGFKLRIPERKVNVRVTRER
ncbi:MAG: hypothetical protein GTO71_10800 [Woeseiaceae bacterium]|nr:hypothetical protein [Woeseiaceae bacterium]NIP21563.1 hypothetical protein [Woeseiaceae bacterium]NIS90551.1 hypothetical protein [Woeseiaceae bacterium]